MDKTEKLKSKLREIAMRKDSFGAMELAKIVGTPFDPENPVADVIQAVYKTDTVDIGEDYEFFNSDQDSKVVTTVTNGSVTQTAVTPLTTTDLTFNTRTSEEFLVYLDKLFAGKHDMLAKKRVALMEALDRIEQYDAIQCIDTAVEAARKFTLDTNKTKFDYPKLIEMVRSIAEYTQLRSTAVQSNTIESNLVLITGSNVTEDVLLMDHDADLNRELNLAKAGISQWIPVDAQQVDLDSVTKNVIDPDVAYLVAPSMREDRETGHFVRRRVSGLDANVEPTERITIGRGPIVTQGSNRKWAFTVAAMEEYGCVISNAKPIAKFTRT